ncbi:hypothetical protein R3P38DRAFT_2846954 [Favolaschia claudopus]|uniref:Uncharacterized protein n=1 Tax=Favolaschia claudopus TaxID=2862362 RepID=A0AAW0DTJ0_9AGAR
MIVPNESKPESTETPLDAPPAYDGASRPPLEKPLARLPPTPTSPSPSGSRSAQSRVVQKNTWTSLGDDVGNLLLSGIGLGSAQRRVAMEVRKTVSGLIHDLVRDQTLESNVSCVPILDSCSEVCAAQSVNLPALLQQPYIEGHTPLYWSIVKRPTEGSEPPASYELPPLIRALLEYSAPLDKATVKDVRLACLHTSDQWLYQALRLSPDFGALSHKDQLLLNLSVPPDTVAVQAPVRHDAPFTVEFEFPQFQKRMRVSEEVSLEFISHARMWEIVFFVSPDSSNNLTEGQWAARLGIMELSAKASMKGQFIFQERVEDGPDQTVELESKGKQIQVALPDAMQYPRSPFLTADGVLRGKLVVQITNK